MKIVIPIGISGSGKSRLWDKVFKDKDFVRVCPDNIREALTGDISDQSKNKEVFEKVDEYIDVYIRYNMNIFYDATNLSTKLRKKFVNKIKNKKNVEEIEYWVLPADVDLSEKRINDDLNNKVNRSRVPREVLERQMNMYNESLKSIESEGVNKILYYTQEDLNNI